MIDFCKIKYLVLLSSVVTFILSGSITLLWSLPTSVKFSRVKQDLVLLASRKNNTANDVVDPWGNLYYSISKAESDVAYGDEIWVSKGPDGISATKDDIFNRDGFLDWATHERNFRVWSFFSVLSGILIVLTSIVKCAGKSEEAQSIKN